MNEGDEAFDGKPIPLLVQPKICNLSVYPAVNFTVAC